MNLPRSSGVQLHPTSLPGGRLGPEAYAFVDWLADAGQTWWQMLPLGPPDRHGSPYKARSAFAAWPGLLADPTAPVSREEATDFRDRHAAWIEDWIALEGEDAVGDQVTPWYRLPTAADGEELAVLAAGRLAGGNELTVEYAREPADPATQPEVVAARPLGDTLDSPRWRTFVLDAHRSLRHRSPSDTGGRPVAGPTGRPDRECAAGRGSGPIR